jgi:hypothetical protein
MTEQNLTYFDMCQVIANDWNKEGKKQKKLIRTNYLDIDNVYITPEYLRSAADAMDRDGVEHITFEFDAGYSNVSVTEYSQRLETDEECQERLKNEQENSRKKLLADAKEKQKLIIAARKLGLAVSSNVNPILSSYDHVYWVPKGTLIEDWVVDKDGYIWYDEVGLLGVQKVYNTAKKANDALESYVAQCL